LKKGFLFAQSGGCGAPRPGAAPLAPVQTEAFDPEQLRREQQLLLDYARLAHFGYQDFRCRLGGRGDGILDTTSVQI